MKTYLSFFFCLFTFTAIFPQTLKKGTVPPPVTFQNFRTGEITEADPGDLHGKVLLIDFWATWCAPCIESIPILNGLEEKYGGKNIQFISLTYEPQELVTDFLKQHPMNSLLGLDTSFTIFRSYDGWAIPNIVMINSEGKYAGRIHPAKLNEKVIDVLLKGGIPDVPNTPDNLYKPDEAEKYFRTYLKKSK